MPATCRCVNGHTFSTRLVDDDPDTNSVEVAADTCPECGTEDFDVLELYDDLPDSLR